MGVGCQRAEEKDLADPLLRQSETIHGKVASTQCLQQRLIPCFDPSTESGKESYTLTEGPPALLLL